MKTHAKQSNRKKLIFIILSGVLILGILIPARFFNIDADASETLDASQKEELSQWAMDTHLKPLTQTEITSVSNVPIDDFNFFTRTANEPVVELEDWMTDLNWGNDKYEKDITIEDWMILSDAWSLSDDEIYTEEIQNLEPWMLELFPHDLVRADLIFPEHEEVNALQSWMLFIENEVSVMTLAEYISGVEMASME